MLFRIPWRARLQPLHEVAGAREVNPIATVDQPVADGAHEVTLTYARRSEQQQIGASLSQTASNGSLRVRQPLPHVEMAMLRWRRSVALSAR